MEEEKSCLSFQRRKQSNQMIKKREADSRQRNMKEKQREKSEVRGEEEKNSRVLCLFLFLTSSWFLFSLEVSTVSLFLD